mgnify:CR=1 FL=1|tara:strand:+ start:2875 stop:3060 length:186 start_codon:yes stop_codon:yes gene_type:complete
MNKIILITAIVLVGCKSVPEPQPLPKNLKIKNYKGHHTDRYNHQIDSFHREYYQKNKISPH